MKSIKAKLHSQKGETLVELLASILVATLSIGLLLGGVAVSAAIDRQAQNMDKTFYEALTKAESRQTSVTSGIAPQASVEVQEGAKSVKIPVEVYGEQRLYAYALEPSTGGKAP